MDPHEVDNIEIENNDRINNTNNNNNLTSNRHINAIPFTLTQNNQQLSQNINPRNDIESVKRNQVQVKIYIKY